MESDCTEAGYGGRGSWRATMMGILSRSCVASDGRSRPPMCLSPKQGAREGHTYWGTTGEGTQRAASHHVATMCYTRGHRSAAEKASC